MGDKKGIVMYTLTVDDQAFEGETLKDVQRKVRAYERQQKKAQLEREAASQQARFHSYKAYVHVCHYIGNSLKGGNWPGYAYLYPEAENSYDRDFFNRSVRGPRFASVGSMPYYDLLIEAEGGPGKREVIGCTPLCLVSNGAGHQVALRLQESSDNPSLTAWYALGVAGGQVAFETFPDFLAVKLDELWEAYKVHRAKSKGEVREQ